ncbi:MAG: diguanylate cyclase, partial [Spirochaetota bacterium]
MLAFLLVALSATLVATLLVIIQTQRTGAAPIPSNRAMRTAIGRLLREELERASTAGVPEAPTRVVDLGSGWGGLTRRLAAENPSVAFTGVELSIVPWAWSQLTLHAFGPANARFERRDLHEALDEQASIFVTYLSPRHMESLARSLQERPRNAARDTVIISAAFALPGCTPDAVLQLRDLYRTPVYRYRLSFVSMGSMDVEHLRSMPPNEIGELLDALSRLGVFLKDLKLDTHIPNRLWAEWGFDPEDMKGDRWLSALHPDDRSRISERFARHADGLDEISQSEYRIVKRSGETCWILSKSVIVKRDKDGAPERMVGIDYDISSMKDAQEAVVRARNDAEDRAREADMLRRAGAAIAATLDRGEAVSRVLEFLKTVVPFETATVQVLRDGALEVVDASGPVAATCCPGNRFPLDSVSTYANVIASASPVVYACPINSSPDLPLTSTTETVSWIGVPLVTRGRTLGLLTLAADACDTFNGRHLGLAEAIADYVALAIQNAELYDRTHEAATRDPLTGAFTRYWFVPFAEREVSRALRENLPIALLVFDLDHFKRINDEYGHPAGDTVLQDLVLAVAAGLRTSDPLCRTGGEEFAVLLPGSDTESAESIGQRMRESAAALTHPA